MRGIGLEESVHTYAEAQAANDFGDVILATQQGGLLQRRRGVRRGANAAHHALHAVVDRCETFGHGGGVVEGSRAGDNAQHGFPGAAAVAHHQFAQHPLMGTRVVQRQISFAGKCLRGLDQSDRQG